MSKQALLIVDMQQGVLSALRVEAEGLISRLNRLAARLRARRLPVIFIQHCGPDGHDLHPSQPGHALHNGLIVEPGDRIITKAYCDAFLDTDLASTLSELEVDEVIVTGYATDFCVDTTIRSALAHGYPTIVPKDGHTAADRPHLSAQKVIEHHHAIWADFISPAGTVSLSRCDDIA